MRGRATPESLAAFMARKTAEADRAALAPFVTVRDAADPTLLRIGNDWSRQLYDGDFYLSPARGDGLPSTSLVFVRSREGNTAAADPSALGGGETDKHVIYEGLSRVAADAVVGGAGTVRSGNVVLSVWRRELVALRAALGLPRHPIQIVATLQGIPLATGLLFNAPDLRVMLITTREGWSTMREAIAARPWIEPIVMRGPEDLADTFRELRQRGIAQLSCIGGRTLAARLIEAGLVRDLYLTTSPRSGGEPQTPLYDKPLTTREIVAKRGTGPDEGVRFEHSSLV